MLETHTHYGFLVSVDEIMFLRADIQTACEYDTSDGYPVDTLTTPHIHYSDPIKFTDAYDEAGDVTVTVKQALWYLIQRAGVDTLGIREEVDKVMVYFATTAAGEGYVLPRPSCMKARR
jgi:hypothetical protein